MKTITNKFKIALAAVGLLAVGTVSAQSTDPAVNTTQGDAAGPSIRLIDNKGTIKYMQSNNGITTITSTAANNLTTTTWQLGGSLLEATTITMNGNDFTLDGNTFKLQNIDTETGIASDATTVGTSGFTLLVRDEATGTVKKMLATDLIQSGQTYFTASDGQTSYDITTGTPGVTISLPTYEKVWVYRNGAKLIANEDYTVAGSIVTLNPGGTAPNDWAVYAGDRIEVQFVK